MPNYRRAWTTAGTFFFTVALADRSSTLLTDKVASLREAFVCAKRTRPFRTDAIVVLPDHLHCIWTLPANDVDFAIRWSHIKSFFSRKLPKDEWRGESRIAKRERGVWQRRFWEHRIRDEADLNAHIDYVHVNPVKHGYVSTAVEWPWSSFHRFVRDGVLALNWAAASDLDAGIASEPVG